MARHADRKNPMPTSGARRALLRAGLTVTAAGAAVAAGAVTASAAPAGGADTVTPVQILASAVHSSTSYGLGPAKNLKLNPLAGTGSDPLDNAVGTQIADFKPISTAVLTGPLASGSSLSELPVIGAATGILPG
ncbi:hypothetical protein ACIREE_00770 [Streptomyces sp. NPDC102467]|uniref:hypothetical protein n=1 Tax=Streptomyces sp. NPDC102467 TaxID=3366179 RepID=UPI00382AE5EB